MSKWIVRFSLCALLLFTGSSSALTASGWAAPTPHRWGATVSEYLRAVPGLTRTYVGLDAEERRYIARYCRDSQYRQADVRIYFSFKSNALYQIEYQFKRPTEKLAASLRADFAQSYGHPVSRRHALPPVASPFSSRSSDSRIWYAADSDVEMREGLSLIAGLPPLRSLFLVFRSRSNQPESPFGFAAARKEGWQLRPAVTLALSGTVDALLIKGRALDLNAIMRAQRGADLRLIWLSGEPSKDIEPTPAAKAFEELEAKSGRPGPAAQLSALGWRVIIADSTRAVEAWSVGLPSGTVLLPASTGLTAATSRELAIDDQVFQFFAYKADSGRSAPGMSDRLKKDLSGRNRTAHAVVLMDVGTLLQADGGEVAIRALVRSGLEAGAALVALFGCGPEPVLYTGKAGASFGLGHIGVSRKDTDSHELLENISLIFWASFTTSGMTGYELKPVETSGIGGDLIRPVVVDSSRYPQVLRRLYERHGIWGMDP
jgi:hypothetical protein